MCHVRLAFYKSLVVLNLHSLILMMLILTLTLLKATAVNVFCASDSCLHVTPQMLVHSFVMTELNSKQGSTKEPAIVAESYLMCQCFPYLLLDFQHHRRKNKKKRHDFL